LPGIVVLMACVHAADLIVAAEGITPVKYVVRVDDGHR
jgi:hypothetical protein